VRWVSQTAVTEDLVAHPRRWLVLATVCAAQFLCTLDLWVVNIAFPALQADLHAATLADVSWVLNVYTIVLAALLVPAGRVADGWGRRACFLAALALFGLSSLGCAIAPALPVLVGFRALQGLAAAVLVPTSLSLALPVFAPSQRATAVGVWAAVAAAAGGSGPVLGGLLVASSWRWIFLINVPIVAATLLAGSWLLPRDGGRSSRRVDLRGALLVLAATALVCTALAESAEWGLAGPRTWLVLAAGLVLAALFVLHLRGRPSAVIDPALFRIRLFAVGAGGILAYYTGFGAMLLGDTLFLTGQLHFSILQAALGIAPGPITSGLIAPHAGRVARRLGNRPTVVLGAAVFAGASVWPLVAAGGGAGYVVAFLPGLLAWGVANGLIQPKLFSSAGAAPPEHLALGSAVLTMARQLGSALGVAILIAILGAAPGLAGFHAAWIFMLVTAVLVGAVGVAFRGDNPDKRRT
jgi:EmrB/QacA subfamily drug resistance transporter